MRLALKIVNRSLSLNWGYAPVASFDKSLFYQNLFYTLRRRPSLPITSLSLLKDPRNLSARWLSLKTPLTPLASTEKKTISGFDTRLAGLKGPTIIKTNRRRGFFTYSGVPTNKVPIFGGVSPLAPFISQGRGWGVRSARANSFLRNNQFLGFKKLPSLGFFDTNFLLRTLLINHKGTLLSEGGALGPNTSFLISSDVNQAAPLLVGKTFFEGRAENPNITAQPQNTQTNPSTLTKDFSSYLFWATGVEAGFSFYAVTGLLIFSKSQTAKRGVAFYL